MYNFRSLKKYIWIFLFISCFYHLEVILLFLCVCLCFLFYCPKEASKWVRASYCRDSGAKTAHVPQLPARVLPAHVCSPHMFAPRTCLLRRVLLALPTALCRSNCHYWGWDSGRRAMLRFLFLLLGLLGVPTDSSGKCTTPQPAPLWPQHASFPLGFLWEVGYLWERALLWELQLWEHQSTPTLPPDPDNIHIVCWGRFPTGLGTMGGEGDRGRREMPCMAWVDASRLVFYKLLCIFFTPGHRHWKVKRTQVCIYWECLLLLPQNCWELPTTPNTITSSSLQNLVIPERLQIEGVEQKSKNKWQRTDYDDFRGGGLRRCVLL